MQSSMLPNPGCKICRRVEEKRRRNQMLNLKDIKPSEAQITQEIRAYLNIRGIPYFKKLQGLGSPKGISDIIGCYKGRFLAIEVKVPGNNLSQEQELFFVRFRIAEGICIVAHSVEEVENELKKYG